jgi:hypothetical protein
MTAFWDTAPCKLVEVDRVSEVLTASPDYRAQYPRRQAVTFMLAAAST